MKKIALFMFVGFLVLVLAGSIYFVSWAQRPLGPALEVQVPAKLQARESAGGDFRVQLFNQESSCGISGVMSLLVLGVNGPVDTGEYGVDSIRLVVIDFDNLQVSDLALSDDLWVDLPADLMADFGLQAPLHQIYRQAIDQDGVSPEDATRHATEVIAQIMVDSFEFVPQKYLNLSGESFVDIINELGGLTVTLESQIDATADGYGIFPEGINQLDGQRTLDFVRILNPGGVPGQDYSGRFQRQDEVIQAFYQSVTEPENLLKIPGLLEQAQDLVVTDLSAAQMRALGCVLENVGEQVDLQMVGEEQVTIDGAGRMIPDVQAIKDMVAAMYEPAP